MKSDKDSYSDVIILLENTIINKIKEEDTDGAIFLLRSQEIQDVLSKVTLPLECDDFMYDYVLDLRDRVKELKRENLFNIGVYNKCVQIYNDYTEICQTFVLGQSNTVLLEVCNILKAWEVALLDCIDKPRDPAFRGLVDNSLPF